MVLSIIFLEDKHKMLLHLSIFNEYQQFFQHRICFSIQPQLQLVNLHRNRRYCVIKLHTWFCLSYFLKTNIKLYCIYQYFMSINSFSTPYLFLDAATRLQWPVTQISAFHQFFLNMLFNNNYRNYGATLLNSQNIPAWVNIPSGGWCDRFNSGYTLKRNWNPYARLFKGTYTRFGYVFADVMTNHLFHYIKTALVA